MIKPSKSELFLEHTKNYLNITDYCENIDVFDEKVFFTLKKPKKLLLTYTHQKFLLDLKTYTTMFGLKGPFEYFEI